MREQSSRSGAWKAKRRAVFRTIGVVAAAALGIYLLVGTLLAGRNLPQISPQNEPMLIAGGEVSNHRLSIKSWTFTYQKAELSPDGSLATLDNLRDGIFYKDGQPLVKVSAKHAQLNTVSYDFTATGNVHIERIGTNQSFDTDLIIWTNALKQLQFPHASYLHTGNQTLEIDNVTINLKNGTVHLGTIDGSLSQ